VVYSVKKHPTLTINRDGLIGLLLISYCMLPLITPPITVGNLQISILDFLFLLSIPALLTAKQFRLSVPALALIAFVFAALISVLWINSSSTLTMALLRAIRFVEIIIPFLLASTITPAPSLLRRMLITFTWSGLVSIIVGIIMFELQISFRDVQTFKYPNGQWLNRAGGIFSDSSAFGHLLATWLLFAYFTINLIIKNTLLRFLSILTILAVSTYALYASLSRSAIIGLLAAIGIFYLIRFPRAWLKFRNRSTKSLLIIISLTCIFAFINFERIENAVSFIKERFIASALQTISDVWNPEQASSGRVAVWQTYLPYLQENPLTGIGYKALKLEYNLAPDNNYLAVLVETGIFGFFWFILFLISLMFHLFKRSREESIFAWLLVIVWTAQMVMAFSLDIMTFWATMPSLLAVTSVVIHSKHDTVKERARL
jgi:O-antigen ligase